MSVSIVRFSRIASKDTVVGGKRRERKKSSLMFVRLSRARETRTHARLPFATNSHVSFIHYEEGRGGMEGRRRKESARERDGRTSEKRRQTVARSFRLSSSSVLCLVECSIVVSLRWVPRPPGASSLLSVSRRIIVINSSSATAAIVIQTESEKAKGTPASSSACISTCASVRHQQQHQQQATLLPSFSARMLTVDSFSFA